MCYLCSQPMHNMFNVHTRVCSEGADRNKRATLFKTAQRTMQRHPAENCSLSVPVCVCIVERDIGAHMNDKHFCLIACYMLWAYSLKGPLQYSHENLGDRIRVLLQIGGLGQAVRRWGSAVSGLGIQLLQIQLHSMSVLSSFYYYYYQSGSMLLSVVILIFVHQFSDFFFHVGIHALPSVNRRIAAETWFLFPRTYNTKHLDFTESTNEHTWINQMSAVVY